MSSKLKSPTFLLLKLNLSGTALHLPLAKRIHTGNACSALMISWHMAASCPAVICSCVLRHLIQTQRTRMKYMYFNNIFSLFSLTPWDKIITSGSSELGNIYW